jgi:hypothetical protein
MRAADADIKTDAVVGQRKRKRFFYVWFIPLIWMAIAGLSLIYRGGENLALGVALIPALLVHQIFGVLNNLGNNFTLPIVIGAVVLLGAGFLLDWARVSLRIFFLSFAAGIVFSYCIIALPFLSEASRLRSMAAAANKFDFNEPERRIAWQILCTALGLYISIPVAVLGEKSMAIYRAGKTQGEKKAAVS